MPWIDPTALPGWDPTWRTFTGQLDWATWIDDGDRAGELVMTSATGTLTW